MSIAASTAPQAGTQASRPSRAVVRWYQLAVIVLGVALAAVTALAIYLAVNHSTAAASPTGVSGTVQPTNFNEDPCYKADEPC